MASRTIVFKRQVEEQFELEKFSCQQARDALEELGLTQVRAAALMGVTARAMRNWLSEEGRLPQAVSNCLQAWLSLHRLNQPWNPLIKKGP